MADLLNSILQITSGQRQFVSDLRPSSGTIEAINDEFPHHCQDLQLYSFYETKPMNLGIRKTIIVPKDSAVLGYSNERSNYLANANHREVCKFANDQEPKYLAVRNGIATVLDHFRGTRTLKRQESDHEQQQQLKEYLEVDDTHDDDFHRVDSARIPGSCSWILESDSFQRWRDSSAAHMYWLTAKPGTGKSILSGFIISYLKELEEDCAFYFFTYGNKSNFNISLLLRSIAWQMSCRNQAIFAYVLKQCKKESHLAAAGCSTIWRKLFLDGIFKLPFGKKQCLVIDALDECRNGADLIPLLIRAVETNAMRIFLTSRDSFESYGVPRSAKLRLISESIPLNSTTADISLYIDANLHNLPLLGPDRDQARKDITTLILKKSSGCFLWVHLVLDELKRVHTRDEVNEVLEDVPSDMDQLYSRILDSMSLLKRGKALTQAVLIWTACAIRPLSVDELHEALELDLNDKVDGVERSIANTCGHLVFVDGNSRVQMVHQTAREYLLRSGNPSEFAIERKDGHKRLGTVCLKYLCGKQMAGLRNRKRSSSTNVVTQGPSQFADYAANEIADHILYVSSEDDEFLQAMGRFLSSYNLLSWVEYIARDSDLNRLVQTGRALRQFLQRRSRYVALFGKDVALLDLWSTDLIRLVTKFGRNLSSFPASIYHHIPPFCPPESALKQQFAASNRSIVIRGLRATTWDDCASVITYQNETPTALACSPSFFAVGQRSGRIKIYDETTCQELRTFSHNETVKMLRFGENGEHLASVATKSISVWNVRSGARIWRFEIDTPCMDLSFVEDDRLLLATLNGSCLWVWDMNTGICNELPSWTDELDKEYVGSRPIAARIGCGSMMLAVAYRGQDVIVWDIENECIHDIYGQDVGSRGPRAKKRSGISPIMSLLLSPTQEPGFLAVGYGDGNLVVFNMLDQVIQARTPANAHSLVSSPNGTMLACSNSAGIIMIFEFESLNLLYRIVSEEYGVKSLIFTANSNRLIDIRGPYCRVWDPPVLLRNEAEDGKNSDTLSVTTLPQDYDLGDTEQTILISAMICVEKDSLIFCGKSDGSICLYDGETGEQKQILVNSNHDSAIECLFYDSRSSILVTSDIDCCTVAYRFHQEGVDWRTKKTFEHRTSTAVTQLLANEGCTRLLISMHEMDVLCELDSEGGQILKSMEWPDRRRYQWSTHPLDLAQVILIMNNTAYLYEWNSLRELSAPIGIQMAGSVLPELSIRAVASCFNDQVMATTFAELLHSRSRSKLILWNSSDLHPNTGITHPIPHYQPLADQVECIIGTYRHRLVFLNHDRWVCSADAQNFDLEFFDRHFFFPADWLSAAGFGGLKLGIFPRSGTVAFVQGDQVALVQKGMEHFEGGHSRAMGRRPSLLDSMRSSRSSGM